MRNWMIVALCLACSVASAQTMIIDHPTNTRYVVIGDLIDETFVNVTVHTNNVMYASQWLAVSADTPEDAFDSVFSSWSTNEFGTITNFVVLEMWMTLVNNENQAQSEIDDLQALIPGLILCPSIKDGTNVVPATVHAAASKEYAIPYPAPLIEKAPPGQLKDKIKNKHKKDKEDGKVKTPKEMRDAGWGKKKDK